MHRLVHLSTLIKKTSFAVDGNQHRDPLLFNMQQTKAMSDQTLKLGIYIKGNSFQDSKMQLKKLSEVVTICTRPIHIQVI